MEFLELQMLLELCHFELPLGASVGVKTSSTQKASWLGYKIKINIGKVVDIGKVMMNEKFFLRETKLSDLIMGYLLNN